MNGLASLDVDDSFDIFAIGGDSGDLYFLNAAKFSTIRTYNLGSLIYDIVHVRNTEFVAASSKNVGVMIYPYYSNTPPYKILEEHEHGFHSSRIRISGNWLMIGTDEGVIDIYNLGDKLCHHSCETCSLSAASNACLKCRSGLTLQNGACVALTSAQNNVCSDN